MVDLNTYQSQFTKTKTGYCCELGYSTFNQAELRFSDGKIINVSRDLFGVKNNYDYSLGNLVHFDSDLNFKKIEIVVKPKRYG